MSVKTICGRCRTGNIKHPRYLFSALGGSEDRFLGRLTPLDRLALCCPDGFPGMIFRSFLPRFADSY